MIRQSVILSLALSAAEGAAKNLGLSDASLRSDTALNDVKE